MKKEVELAANFLLQLLTNTASTSPHTSPSNALQLGGGEKQKEFLEVCKRRLDEKCSQSWREDFPEWGSAYRAIVLQPDYVDPILMTCAQLLNMSPDEIRLKMASSHLILWIDPNSVSFKMGEKGTIKFLYQSMWNEEVPAKTDPKSGVGAGNALSCKHQMRAVRQPGEFPICEAPQI